MTGEASNIGNAYIDNDIHQKNKTFLMYQFPEDKRRIGKLSYENKLEWYQYQFERRPGVYPVELTSKEFMSFWKWKMVIPMKIKRLFYRIKNREIFKKYAHITEIRKKVKPYSI